MKPNQTVPLLATLAPAVAVVPPLLFGAVIGLGLIWLFSNEEKQPEAAVEVTSAQPARETPRPLAARWSSYSTRSIMMEDLAEVFEQGTRELTRPDAVAALQARGFGTTAAYQALSASGRFAQCFPVAPDGVLAWVG